MSRYDCSKPIFVAITTCKKPAHIEAAYAMSLENYSVLSAAFASKAVCVVDLCDPTRGTQVQLDCSNIVSIVTITQTRYESILDYYNQQFENAQTQELARAYELRRMLAEQPAPRPAS